MLTAPQLLAVRQKAISMAKACEPSRYASALTHIAKDCDYAAEGCEASMNSVLAFLATDHALDMALYPDEPEARPAHFTLGVAA